ncbi:hypothetical protein [Salisediminibacterium halotolerans]|uniref:hypothetical protein n=1 Tax=Salisediminibacterium halotolerans TaxID=517425 RepID=UPI000F1A2D15|nr:hypothetical protein [Salisediminibacterium halotolerans]RLJ74402.1 hypothetical protein BCL39_1692 [Actinophytocola xinjiangensis]RPE87505.1 hypothetical protein EDD67_1239 [Salisediminibacterium halotolerans]TWG35239.1 hypothetical protein BCL52_1689 [Salisediminibacterium halotolerans]GEL09229.1 hypothetical protein SHA02_26450 [Salisediminibacterium halotolerans]
MTYRHEKQNMGDFLQNMRNIESENLMLSEEDRHRHHPKGQSEHYHTYLFF